MKDVPKVPTKRIWAKCPNPECGAKVILYDDTANCSGIWCKCTRKCGLEFELIVVDGKQIFESEENNNK